MAGQTKTECEEKFTDYILKIGLNSYIAMDEGKNTYYEFRLKNGEYRYWKNISDKNFKKLGL